MDLLQLMYFCDAAENEKFSRTAEKFTVPTSNLSQVIRRLEKDLGTPLFERKGNRVHLNSQGRIFYRHARVALNAMKATRQEPSDKDEVSGDLHVFVGCNRAAQMFTDMLEDTFRGELL